MLPRKRKHGDVALAQDTDLAAIESRKKVTQAKRFVPSYSKINVTKAHEIISWFVQTSQTQCLLSGSDHEFAKDSWWFNWKKIDKLAPVMTSFFASKQRTLKGGEVVGEAASNLGKYRTAISHWLERDIVSSSNAGNSLNLDPSKISAYKNTIAAHFSGIRKQEQELKRDGKVPIKVGGSIFTQDFYFDVSKRLLEFSKPRSALFNHAGMHTAGRMGNVGALGTPHFTYFPDCTAVQFPITKTSKEGEGDVQLHFYGE